MRERSGTLQRLTVHFFRRFFDNDTVQVDGDTVTTVARALAMVAMPGLLVAFFIQNQYPQRDLMGRWDDEYFFVLLTFVVMGMVTVFEWEMLFPDRSDFLVLTPLPLGQARVMAAKVIALCSFFALFLAGSSLPGAVLYPMIVKGPFFRPLLAHVAATGLGGIFLSAALVTLSGLLRCLLRDRHFRVASAMLQTAVTGALVLLLVQYARYGQSLHLLLAHVRQARWLPPLWFLGLYEELLHGAAAPEFARALTPWAVWGTGIALLLAVATYPGAWARMRRMVLEGEARRGAAPLTAMSRGLAPTVRTPQERAMFCFVGQTLRRIARYHIYLAMYGGTGLALALACGVVLRSETAAPSLSDFGLHAVVALLCFWVVAGLRTAFAFPETLAARWVFRVAGSDDRDLAAAGKRWAGLAAAGLLCISLATLAAAGWTARQLLVQAICGTCLATLLTDAFFSARTAPLIQPRMPGRSNFALFLTLYVGVLTPFLFGIVYAEERVEQKLWLVIPVMSATALLHLAVRHLAQQPMEAEEEMEGYDGVFQTLNLQ